MGAGKEEASSFPYYRDGTDRIYYGLYNMKVLIIIIGASIFLACSNKNIVNKNIKKDLMKRVSVLSKKTRLA